MTFATREEITKQLLNYMINLGRVKSNDYASDADTLSNFKVGGHDLYETPQQYLLHLQHKHQTSITKATMLEEEHNEKKVLRIIDRMMYDVLHICLEMEQAGYDDFNSYLESLTGSSVPEEVEEVYNDLSLDTDAVEKAIEELRHSDNVVPNFNPVGKQVFLDCRQVN